MPVRSNSHLSSCFQAPSRLTGSCRRGARCLPPPGAGAVGRLAHDGPPSESRRRVAARRRSRARVLGASTLGRGAVLASAGPAVLGCGALASATSWEALHLHDCRRCSACAGVSCGQQARRWPWPWQGGRHPCACERGSGSSPARAGPPAEMRRIPGILCVRAVGLLAAAAAATLICMMPAASPPLVPPGCPPSPPHVCMGRSSMSGARICA